MADISVMKNFDIPTKLGQEIKKRGANSNIRKIKLFLLCDRFLNDKMGLVTTMEFYS